MILGVKEGAAIRNPHQKLWLWISTYPSFHPANFVEGPRIADVMLEVGASMTRCSYLNTFLDLAQTSKTPHPASQRANVSTGNISESRYP